MQKKISKLVKENKRYLLIVLFFVMAFLYHFSVVSFKDTSLQKEAEDSEVSSQEEPDINSDNREKIYLDSFEAREGDVYRVGAKIRSEKPVVLEVLFRSQFDAPFKIGEWNVLPSKEGEFYDTVAMSPGSFDDVVFRLKKDGVDVSKEWRRQKVFLDAFFVTRVEVNTWPQIASLRQTEYRVGGLEGARLEDIGKYLLYTFSLSKDTATVAELHAKSESILYDEEKEVFTGKQKKGEYLTYKFDLQFPFEKLILDAEQAGKEAHEITLDYSFDGKTWKTIDYFQRKGESQRFHLSLLASQNQKTIYVRARYDGPDKKKSTFALESLSLKALLPKPEK